MKLFLTILTTCTVLNTTIAQDIYQEKMQEALAAYAQVENLKDYKNAAANFERITQVETEKWEPHYYLAQTYIMMSFTDTKAEVSTKDAYLNEAEPLIEHMIEIAPSESEIYALQALYYTAKLVVDPMNRGQKYSALTQASVQKSLALDAENPRAAYLNLSNKIGTAQFFNQDITSFCTEAELLYNRWDQYKLKGPFYPKWGKQLVAGIIENCGQTDEQEKSVSKMSTEKSGNKLTITVSNLKSNSGLVLMELLDENEKTISQAVGTVKNNKSVIVIDGLSTGTYALRYFHDSNENNKMDTYKYGIPTETYGFSNNKRGFMGPPKFKKTTFSVNKDLVVLLKAK